MAEERVLGRRSGGGRNAGNRLGAALQWSLGLYEVLSTIQRYPFVFVLDYGVALDALVYGPQPAISSCLLRICAYKFWFDENFQAPGAALRTFVLSTTV